MTETWHQHRDWFLLATKGQQVRYVSSLLYRLSMMARTTYEPGTENLVKPTEMRRFNEFIHRVAAHQLEIIEDDPKRMPDEVFFEYLAEASMEINVPPEVLLQKLRRQSG